SADLPAGAEGRRTGGRRGAGAARRDGRRSTPGRRGDAAALDRLPDRAAAGRAAGAEHRHETGGGRRDRRRDPARTRERPARRAHERRARPRALAAVVRLAYLGPPGTFGEEAALHLDPSAELVPLNSHSAGVAAVAGGDCERGVAAIENSLE